MKLIPRAFAKFHQEIAKFTRPEENYDSDDVMMTSCDHKEDVIKTGLENNIQMAPPIEISVIKNRFSICSRMHQKQGWLTLELYKNNLPFGQVYQVNKRKWFKIGNNGPNQGSTDQNRSSWDQSVLYEK